MTRVVSVSWGSNESWWKSEDAEKRDGRGLKNLNVFEKKIESDIKRKLH